MQLRFGSLDDWLERATYRYACDLPVFSLTYAAGRVLEIRPFLAVCQDVLIIGGDWIPAYSDGLALIEQMVHTPSQYLEKAINIKLVNGHYTLETQPVEALDEDVVLIGGRDNYYHWLIDFLPRLILAEKVVGERKLIVNQDLAAYQLESLKALGYEPSDLLPLGDRQVVRPRSTLVPSLLASTTVPHKALPGLLRAAFPATKSSGCDRVYLSRQDAATRKLSNEDALIALLERHGFTTFRTEKMSFEDQRNLFHNAKAVVAVHGAGMANILFCPSGTHVFEIFSPALKVTSMYLISMFCRHHHEFVPARNLTFGANGNPLLGTWEVDLDAMAVALKKTLGAT